MATATLESFKLGHRGDQAALITVYDADKFIDAATTVQFTAGTNEFTITHSGGGFADRSVGDQIEISGAGNDENNGFFRINSKASSYEVTVELRGTGANTNGVTEAAGNAITISLVPQDTDTTNGTLTLSNGSTVTIENTSPQNDNHKVYMFSHCTVDPPVCHPSVDGDVTVTGIAGAAWTDGAGNLSPAFSTTAITNYSRRLDADARYDYDNDYLTVHGIGDAPYGVGAAVDPSTHADIVDWWAPDLETGYTDEDDFDTLVGQEGVKNLTPRSGTAQKWAWDEDSINGVTGVRMKSNGGNEWRLAWTGLTNFGSGSPTTKLMVIFTDDAEEAFTIYKPISWNDTSANLLANRFDALTGVAVVAVREDGSGNGDVWYNYSREEVTGISGQARMMNCRKVGGLTVFPRVGRIYEFSSEVSDADLETYVRWLLNFYGAADWAPQIHVAETGNNSNPGTQASPMLTVQGACDKYFPTSMHETTTGSTNPTFPAFAPQFIVPEGDVVDIRLEADTNTRRIHNGYGDANWSSIRVRRTSSSPYPTFRSLGDGNGEQELVRVQGGGAGGVVRKMAFIGSNLREPRKIPTSSPLREGGDAAFDGGFTTQNRAVSILQDGTGSVPTIVEVSVENFHSIGGGKIVTTHEDMATTLECYVSFGRISTAHAHGAGHTNPYFVDGPYIVLRDDWVAPSPGWEPIDSVEIDDSRSHATYDQYSGVGVKAEKRSFVTEPSSHFLQARAGGYVVDGCIMVNTGVGVFAASGSVVVKDTLIEGGRDIASTPVGWGVQSKSSILLKLDNVLMLGAGYTSGYSIEADHSDDFFATDATAGPADGAAFLDMNGSYRKVELNAVKIYQRAGTAIEFTGVENSTLTNCTIDQDGPGIVINNSDAEVTAGSHTMTGCTFNLTTGPIVEVDSATKTLAEYEALLDTASDNSEEAPTFSDATRTVEQYAQTYLSDGSATANDLALEAVRLREAGTYDADIETDTIREWVFAGFQEANWVTDTGGPLPVRGDWGIFPFNVSMGTQGPTSRSPSST